MVDTTLIEGSFAAGGCVVVSVTIIWCIRYFLTPQFTRWYIPISWLMIVGSVLALAGISFVGGWPAAIAFTATYIALTVIPPMLFFYVGVDAISVLMVGSIIVSVELVCILAFIGIRNSLILPGVPMVF